MKKLHLIFLCLIFCHLGVFSQTTSNDSIKLNYSEIYSYCIQTDIKPVFSLLDVDTNKLSSEDIDFKIKFENRFKYKEDRDIIESQKLNSIDSLVNIFKNYWRSSLLDPNQDYDSLLRTNLRSFFGSDLSSMTDTLNVDSCIQNLVSDVGYYALYGKVGRLKDLLIWQTQTDTTYTFSIHTEEIIAEVIFLEDFVTLGWGNYATLNKSIGGWAKNEALYCVKESYDIESDWFTIHYLAHEGRHFSDYKVFPKLSGYDLEYRAKLTELSLAQETLYPLLKQFISIANHESENQHPVANYFVIENLSKKIFNSEFENDIEKWKSLDIEIINEAAYALLVENTEELHNQGDDVENYIRK